MRFCFIIVLSLMYIVAQSQKQGRLLMDSLLKALPLETNDTVKARIYNHVATYYVYVNTDTAFLYASSGMQLVQKMKWMKGISAFHVCFGNIFSSMGSLDSCISRYQQAQDISIAINDTINMAINYNNLGGVANAKSDFVSAARYFTATLTLGLASRNTYSISLACENLSLVYFNQKDYQKSLTFARQALDACEKGKHTELKQSALKAIANAFREMKQYDSAFIYYQEALRFCRQNDNKMEEATTLGALAEYYANQQKYDTALEYGLASKKIWDATGPLFEDAITNTGFVGSNYLQLAKRIIDSAEASRQTIAPSFLLNRARYFLSEAVKNNKLAGNKVAELEFQRSLAEVYAMTGNYKEAYLNVIHYQDIKDSVYSQENKNKIAAAVGQLEIDKKNQEITINQLTIANQHRQQAFFVVALMLLALVGALFYRQSILRKKTNTALVALNNQLEEANRLKSRFFAILSHDFRAPVASLISFLRLQKEDPNLMTAEQTLTGKQKITAASEALLGNMETMLLWSKGQMENFTPVMKAVPVKDLFVYISGFFANSPNVKFAFADTENIEIYTDENYLCTIMQNLTANAIKALNNTPDACIKWQVISKDQMVNLSISDNGPGMSQVEMNAFYSHELVANKKYGFGLYLVRELARTINCSISCHSLLQQGTTFVLAFHK
ncbi:MAG: tetratricopeptide repeat-containing sensor histidine kinase [Chitinophagaceae bacterium]|nr:tetratricopeptide repeat-containing sensor histidine kinase [Chitinophagaceae bacterium]